MPRPSPVAPGPTKYPISAARTPDARSTDAPAPTWKSAFPSAATRAPAPGTSGTGRERDQDEGEADQAQLAIRPQAVGDETDRRLQQEGQRVVADDPRDHRDEGRPGRVHVAEEDECAGASTTAWTTPSASAAAAPRPFVIPGLRAPTGRDRGRTRAGWPRATRRAPGASPPGRSPRGRARPRRARPRSRRGSSFGPNPGRSVGNANQTAGWLRALPRSARAARRYGRGSSRRASNSTAGISTRSVRPKAASQPL